MSDPLFQPLAVGPYTLQHRIVMPPLTRFRCSDDGVPIPELVVPYYAERCLVPGTLIIAEATDVNELAGGFANVPGIYTDAQIEGWKAVTKAVHDRDCVIFLQLWAIGRANPGTKQPDVVSAGNIAMKDGAQPRALSNAEVKMMVRAFGQAAANAVKAGFDGIEIHGAHGYLVDQFSQAVSNNRTDEYGGSVENRARFALNVVGACAAAIGADKVAIRLSPFATVYSTGWDDPYPQYSYIINQLRERHPSLAYLHVVEPRVNGTVDRTLTSDQESNSDAYKALWPGVYIVAGGFMPDTAREYVRTHDNALVAFGRRFISNPDLVAKIKEGLPFVPYNRKTFYLNKAKEGYLGYEYAKELKGIYY
ncbi:hypothetical protein BZA70DRAFT_299815 [Myxozyma melibiosi]|uniref:NADH:flavin oxidoreductase/NADH oxidase N-terminal domain-containing protein n=1 Tax=Myxozyma melibiosi TaxID=54550 RepID=A0ABR1F1Q3_9ASCO